ncbi:hypothetical protein JST97_32200 [bacterium]|nr:hypothetical protein [bacterium]
MKKLILVLATVLSTSGWLAAEELTGKLIVPRGAATKESYLIGNFQLLGRKGKVILSESKQVSSQTLNRFRDQWVSIQAEFQPAQTADPQEQAPLIIGPDGKTSLQDHPASYRVISIQAYKGPRFPLPKP